MAAALPTPLAALTAAAFVVLFDTPAVVAQCGPDKSKPYPAGSSTCPAGPGDGGGGGTGTSSSSGAAACAQDGSSYYYAEGISGTARTITTNHCPNHPNYNLNPNYAVNKNMTYSLPAKPTFVGAATDSSTASAHIDLSEKGGAIGVFFNAAQLYSPYGGPMYGKASSWETSATYAEGNTFDQCGCHASSTSAPSYHCHVPPSCLLKQLGQNDTAHSPQIGWAFDGFPVYGPRGPGGVMMKTCTQTGGSYGTDVCTDDCGGYYSADGSIDDFTYRYYTLGQYGSGTSCDAPGCPSPTKIYHPTTMMCFRGCCPSGQTCHSSIAACPATGTLDGFIGSYDAANALTMDSGLPKNTAACACDDLKCEATCAEQGWKDDASSWCASASSKNSCPANYSIFPDQTVVSGSSHTFGTVATSGICIVSAGVLSLMRW